MVLESFFPDVVIPDKPFGRFVFDRLEKFGDTVALVEFHSGNEITFRELREKTLEMVKLLWKAGLRKGDIVGLVMPFDMQYVPLYMAAFYCGGVLFGTKLLYKSAIHSQLAAVKPVLVVTTSERYENVSEYIKSNDLGVKLCLTFNQLQKIEPGSLRKTEDDMPCYGAIDVHNDPAIIYLSSGTTGEPKGIEITHYNMTARIITSMANIPLSPGNVMASEIPIIHAQTVSMLFYCLCQGIKLIYAHSLTAKQHLEVVSRYKVNFLSTCDITTLKGMIDQKDSEPAGYDFSSLQKIMVSGAAFPATLIQYARDSLGVNVAMGYGMTEVGRVSVGRSKETPPNSVGLLDCNLQLKVVDRDNGKELKCGEKGEICIKGPQIMKKYRFVKERGISNVLENGWLHSGDFGYYDVKGYIYVLGRVKDAIKVQPGNITVMPVDLEEVLLRHRQIKDVAVVGVAHPDYGEAPRAFVVRKDISLTEEEVLLFFQTETEQFTNLDGGVQFVDSIPRTERGKPQRRLLIENSSSCDYN